MMIMMFADNIKICSWRMEQVKETDGGLFW